MELYHIHSHNSYDDLYKVGNTITIGENYNSMTELMMNEGARFICNPATKEVRDILRIFDNMSEMKIKDAFPYLEAYIHDMAMNSREFILEQVRLNINKDLPSRYKCMWLTDENSLSFWKKRINGRVDSIYKVEVDGNVFETADSLLPHPMVIYNSMYEQAYKYWQPDQEYLKNAKDKEYLFTGELKILKKIK